MSQTAAVNPESNPDLLGSYGVPRLGVDNAGREHYLDAENDRILVARDGDVVHTEDLDGRPPTDWVAYVAERSCGWQTHGRAQVLDVLARLAGGE